MLSLLRSNGEMSVRELVPETGLSVSQVRYKLNALISAGVIEPTVGATSRLRRCWYVANEAWWRPAKAATEARYAEQGQ